MIAESTAMSKIACPRLSNWHKNIKIIQFYTCFWLGARWVPFYGAVLLEHSLPLAEISSHTHTEHIQFDANNLSINIMLIRDWTCYGRFTKPLCAHSMSRRHQTHLQYLHIRYENNKTKTRTLEIAEPNNLNNPNMIDICVVVHSILFKSWFNWMAHVCLCIDLPNGKWHVYCYFCLAMYFIFGTPFSVWKKPIFQST